jgi:2-oxoglutarate ferredoxin oxidoreductase subunit gamma
MNEASLGRFIDSVPDGGLLIVNSSAVREIPERKKIVIRSAAFDKIAVSIGDKRSANMAALGFLSALKGLFPLKELEQSVSSVFPKGEIRDKNIKALREGFGLLNVNGGI